MVRRNRIGAISRDHACGVLTFIGLYRYGSESVSAYNSMEIPAELIAARLPADASIVSYGTTSHTLAFYSGRPVRLLEDSRGRRLLNGEGRRRCSPRSGSCRRFAPGSPAALRLVGRGLEEDAAATLPPPIHADRRILLPVPKG